MASRPPERQRALRLEYQFDRLLAEKLAHAYELLVPDQVRPIRADACHPGGNQEVLTDESGGIVRACIVRSPEGESHDLQPVGSPGGVCRQPRLSGFHPSGASRMKATAGPLRARGTTYDLRAGS